MRHIELRPYQQSALDELLEAYEYKSNACVVAPTGAGKTIIILMFVKKLRELYPNLSIVIMTHRVEILNNLRDTLSGLGCDFYSVQKLSRRPELRYDVLITDEAHHVVAKSYRQVINTNCAWHCGFTATPLRGYIKETVDFIPVYKDTWKYELTGLVNDSLYTRFITTVGTKALIEQNFLCDYLLIHDYDFHIQHTGSNMQDYTKKEVDQAITVEECEAYVRKTLGDKQGIVFCHSIEFADKLTDLLKDKGVLITSKTPKGSREKLFANFRLGKFQLMVNVDVFGEGVDVPAVDCVYLFRPTRSIPVYFQQIGRALRLANGKKLAYVYDYVNNYKRLGVEPKDISPKDMLLTGKFIKDSCEYCGKFAIVEGERDRVSGSVPSPMIQSMSRWMQHNFNKFYYFFTTDNRYIQIRLKEGVILSNEDLLTYLIDLEHKRFRAYNMAIVRNTYGRWEVATVRNASHSTARKNGYCLLLEGKCKFCDEDHPYYLVLENMVSKPVRNGAKIKK